MGSVEIEDQGLAGFPCPIWLVEPRRGTSRPELHMHRHQTDIEVDHRVVFKAGLSLTSGPSYALLELSSFYY
jgi:hypothetical protein